MSYVPPNIELQERDVNFFRLVTKTKVFTPAAAKVHYQAGTYTYKRLQYLAAHGYLQKQGHYYLLTSKAADEIGTAKPRVSPYQYKTWSMASEINVRVKDFDIITTGQLREEFNQNREVKYKCALQHKIHSNVVYIAYFVPSGTTISHLGSIANEIQYLAINKIATKFVIFADQPYKIWYHFQDLPATEDVYILPHIWGLTLLEYRHSEEYATLMADYNTGAEPSDFAIADWKVGDTYYTDLLTNNVKRRGLLQRYGPLEKSVRIFALDITVPGLQEEIHGVEFIPVHVPGLPAELYADYETVENCEPVNYQDDPDDF